MLTDAIDGRLFRLERMMAKVWRLQVTTIRREHHAYFSLGKTWTMQLDADQIDLLTDYLDSEHAFLEQADKLLDACMRLDEVRQEHRPDTYERR